MVKGWALFQIDRGKNRDIDIGNLFSFLKKKYKLDIGQNQNHNFNALYAFSFIYNTRGTKDGPGSPASRDVLK